jgi:hypothetical protein
MSHHSRVQKIVIDVPGAEAHRAAEFWRGAVGVNLTRLFPDFPEYVGADLPYAEHLTLLIQELEEGHPRIHLDIHTDDVEAEVARLEQLGAVRVRQVHTWWVMGDPAGLPFCVLPASAGSLTDENSARWD